MPRKGKISGPSLAALRGVVTLLTDPAKMREHGKMMLEGSSRGLLGDPDAIQAEVVTEAEHTCETNGQGDGPPLPAAKPVPLTRVSAFW